LALDISRSVNCISYGEPLLWVSIALASIVGCALGSILLRRAREKSRIIKQLGVALIVAVPLTLLASYVLLAVMYAVVRGGAVCVQFVRPALLLAILLPGAWIVGSALLRIRLEKA
jgi:hypothetical protein